MKVLIVDDDNLVAMSLRTILSSDNEIEVVATGNSGEDAIRLYDEFMPDVLLMDIRMAGMTGLEAGSEIIGKHNDARILYLTTFNDDEYIVKAISIGARGYIIKQDFDSIIPAVKTVFNGQSVVTLFVEKMMYGSEIFDQADSYGTNDLLVVIGIYAVIATVCTTLAVYLLNAIAEREGRHHFLQVVWNTRYNKAERLVTPAFVAAIVLAVIFMITEMLLPYILYVFS